MSTSFSNIYLLSLGCAKNQVDSEFLLGRFAERGMKSLETPEHAELIVVNTCSFIESAIDESIDCILELAEYRKRGTCRRLVVIGCLPQRFGQELADSLPEVDVFAGTGALHDVVDIVLGAVPQRNIYLPDPGLSPFPRDWGKRIISEGHTAYLKIAEGCSKVCTYCIIPKIRGRFRSRKPDEICREAEALLARGVKELVPVAQESSFYGLDLRPAENLAGLLKRLSNVVKSVSDEAWIRVLYCHPESLTEEIIQTVASAGNICSYFDVPVQHASDRILKLMGRRHSRQYLASLFGKIRAGVPNAVLRTTVIVGFPGETEDDFQQLLDFVEKTRFDRLGAFMYSDGDDIASHGLRGHVDKRTAAGRLDALMKLQEEISFKSNEKLVGETLTVLVEKQEAEDEFAGRTEFQAPEVDGVTFVRGEGLNIGEFARVRITEALEYDLVGKAV